MNEQELKQSGEFENENGRALENNDIDLGSNEDEFDPFGDTDFGDEPAPETKPTDKPKANTKPAAKANAGQKAEISANPLEKAMEEVETRAVEEIRQGLFAKAPVFSYAAASEPVEDTSKTFEELRIEKASDFPELDDGKRVSWTVEYGKITKAVTDPKGTTIGKMKSKIETSKEFLDSLKKAKDKEPECKLKPKVTAQSKGRVAAYKGVFTSFEDAVASDKLITIFPAKNGKVYEMRRNELGRFITPTRDSDMLSDVKAGFHPALPLVPRGMLLDVIGFFKLMALRGNCEALVNVYWDKGEQMFIADVPKQTVTPFSVESVPSAAYDNDRYIHYMDIHSHNRMSAVFSATDDRDEKTTRVYAVIGDIYSCFPQIKVRISNGGTFLEIDPATVFEDSEYDESTAENWLGMVEVNPDGGKTPAKKCAFTLPYLRDLPEEGDAI